VGQLLEQQSLEQQLLERRSLDGEITKMGIALQALSMVSALGWTQSVRSAIEPIVLQMGAEIARDQAGWTSRHYAILKNRLGQLAGKKVESVIDQGQLRYHAHYLINLDGVQFSAFLKADAQGVRISPRPWGRCLKLEYAWLMSEIAATSADYTREQATQQIQNAERARGVQQSASSLREISQALDANNTTVSKVDSLVQETLRRQAVTFAAEQRAAALHARIIPLLAELDRQMEEERACLKLRHAARAALTAVPGYPPQPAIEARLQADLTNAERRHWDASRRFEQSWQQAQGPRSEAQSAENAAVTAANATRDSFRNTRLAMAAFDTCGRECVRLRSELTSPSACENQRKRVAAQLAAHQISQIVLNDLIAEKLWHLTIASENPQKQKQVNDINNSLAWMAQQQTALVARADAVEQRLRA
jgi:hypothetical protein